MKPALIFSRGTGVLVPEATTPSFRYLLFEHQGTFTAILQDVATGVNKPEWAAVSEEIQMQNLHYMKAQTPYLVCKTDSPDDFVRYRISGISQAPDTQRMNRDEVEQSIGGSWKTWVSRWSTAI